MIAEKSKLFFYFSFLSSGRRAPPGLLAAFRGPGTRSVPPCVRFCFQANMKGSRFLRQFCTFVGLMLKTAGHENSHDHRDT